jgi:syntaxin-binding protein 1
MDLVAPLIHEFTYQAMAHDLLPIREADRITYKTVLNEGRDDQEVKDMEIQEADDIWVKNRHTHMKDTIERLMGDFQKFIDDNPHFTNQSDATSLNAIKDMLAGLPQFQSMKEAYSLHLSMAQECMAIFQQRKLPDIASVEQTLATGLDEDYRKPKNLADQLVRLLDDESTAPQDRLRLILLYILYKDGIVAEDIPRLLAHAGLPPQNLETMTNMELLGARTTVPLKDKHQPPPPLFVGRTAPTAQSEEYALSRYEPQLKLLLQELVRGQLDPGTFPYTKPPADTGPEVQQTSLRSAKPTWAQNRRSTHENRQRIIVFVAGGATYSESRACYEVSRESGKDVLLATSHMLTPELFIRQVTDLSVDRRRLDLPPDRPKKKAPAHVFERETPPKPPPHVQGLPSNPKPQSGGVKGLTGAMGNMGIGGKDKRPPTAPNGSGVPSSGGGPIPQMITPEPTRVLQGPDLSKHRAKLEKKDKDGEGKDKKKRGLFGMKKK